jgi:integrase/recombinase XerD
MNIVPHQNQTDLSGASNDDKLIRMWLGARARNSEHTYRSYSKVAFDFLTFIEEDDLGLRTCPVSVLMEWLETLEHLSPRTQSHRMSVVKSLYSFACETGYCQHNITAVVKGARTPNDLAERILTEEQVHRIFAAATPRTETLVRLLYYTGARIRELCRLKWGHVRATDDGEIVVMLHGKGNKIRYVRLKGEHAGILSEPGNPDSYVLATRTSLPLHPAGAVNLIRLATVNSGLAEWELDANGKRRNSLKGLKVSPHWFRHAHASHALDRGAPPHLVQQTLGHASLATTTRDASGRDARLT